MTRWRTTSGALIVAAAIAVVGWGTGLAEEERAPQRTPDVRRITGAMAELPLADHVAVVERLQQELARRVLTPSEAVRQRYAELVEPGRGGVTRLLHRHKYWNRLGFRGDGSYHDFDTGRHGMGNGRDISIDGTHLYGVGAGGSFAAWAVLEKRDIRDTTLADVPASVRRPRIDVASDRGLRRFRASSEPGPVVAMRAVDYGNYDRLYLVQVVDADEDGVSIAWRLIDEYAAPPRRPDGRR